MSEPSGMDFTPPALAAVPPPPTWPSVTLPTGEVFVLGLELPSGAQVTFKDPTTLRAGDRKRVMRTIQDPERIVAAGLDVTDGVVSLLVEGWTLDLPIPSVLMGSLDQLTIPDADALTEHCGPVATMLFPDHSPTQDRTSPTGPSNG